MPNTRTVFIARDESGIFLYDTRPMFEDGIWIAAADSKTIIELTWNETQLFGLEPEVKECYDVTIIATLIEKVPEDA